MTACIRIFLIALAIAIAAVAFTTAQAEGAESPYPIGFYCDPYTQPFTEGGFYEPSTSTAGTCTFYAADVPRDTGVRFGALFRGTIGSSTEVTSHSLGVAAESVEQHRGRIETSPQGEPYFAVIWNDRVFWFTNPSETTDFVNYFTTAANPPPHNNYGFVQWQWGTSTPTTTPPCTENCFSSVLFLPGIMGSRLYEGGTKRWESSSDADVVALKLDENGKSESPNVTATEVIDVFDGPLIADVSIYDSFLEDLETEQTEGVIAGFAAIPYDWRLSFPDILADGSIESTLRALAASSTTGRVTIVAHSNGGILAKALLNELGAEASDLVDKLILVGVPQIGTPKAAGAILHGYDAGIQFVISDERARDLAKNAPFIYQLLPHTDYADFAGATIPDPIISFEDSEAARLFFDEYGGSIDSSDEMKDFLIGAEGRSTPAFEDLKNPGKGNATLLDAAVALEAEIGSAWQPPTGITVHQIAGIGEDTLAGIAYKTVQECTEYLPIIKGICLAYEPRLSYTPQEVVDGDGTVVVPSALAMSTSTEQVKRWWVDLSEYHKDHQFQLGPFRKNHKNIVEVDELRTFIFNHIVSTTTNPLPTYIFSTAPIIESGNRLRFILHSPLALSATDAAGNEVSVYTVTIPGASFKRYGEVQAISIPADTHPTVHLTGITDGSFTLEVEQYSGDVLIATTTMSGIPSLASTSASMSFPDGTIANAGDLELDYDGDGTTDFTLAPEEGEEVSLPEPSLPSLIEALKGVIGTADMGKKVKQQLLKKIENLEKKLEKKKRQYAKILVEFERKISKQEERGNIATADAVEILALVELLEAQVGDVALDPTVLAALTAKIASLDVKESVKKNLLHRVEALEKKQQLTNTLAHLMTQISKRTVRGDIDEGTAEEMLKLLTRIELMI